MDAKEVFSDLVKTSNYDNFKKLLPRLGKTFLLDNDSEAYKEIYKNELRSIIFDILNSTDSVMLTPELKGIIYPIFDGDKAAEIYIHALIEHKKIMHYIVLSILNFAENIKKLNIDNMTEKDIADMKTSISELREQINKLNSDIEEKRVTIRQQAKIIADDMNNDRLTTVPQFYNIVDKERDWKGKKASKETMIRKTQEALSNKQCFSMFKSKKEGRYYRIEDIVDAAISLEYVRQEYKWSVIEEMKYKDNSRTKTDLDSEGFETSERNGSGI